MRNIIVIFLFLSFGGISRVQGQTALEKEVEKMHVSMKMPSSIHASQNEDVIYLSDSEQHPGQNSGINSIFGGIHSILEDKDGKYVILVYASPRITGSSYGKIMTDSTELYTLTNLAFGRIKKDFRYGIPNVDAIELEADELYSMLTHYPREQAQEMFNANVMVMYPLNLRGNVYKDKYTRGRAVVVAKNRLHLYFYFLLTDESVKNFDTYLQNLNKVFWFNE